MGRNSITKRLREQNRAEKAESARWQNGRSARFSNQNSRSIPPASASSPPPSRVKGVTEQMALRRLYAPFRPDLNNFLFAAVGEERNGIPLSMMSALAQLDLDPWEEAGRLSALAKQEAIERLTGLILRLPGFRRPSSEAQQIAAELVDALPKHNGDGGPAKNPGRAAPRNIASGKAFWLLCLAVAAIAFFLMLTQGDLTFGDQRPQPAVETPANSK